ncbi:MAG: hypothetical protein ACJAYN_003542 [Bermanella sp.]|jgi:hypothetical protein
MNVQTIKKITLLGKTVSFFLCVIFTPASIALDNEEKTVLPHYVFTATDNPMLQAQTALRKASAENKYALIVLGAQWCHDSVGLAERFSTNKMQTVLSERYVTQFIDVGYLEDRRDITSLVGYPNYFATPTVLIVDPISNTVMNMDSLKKWQSADSVELQIYIKQFSRFKKEANSMKLAQTQNNPYLKAFETQHGERLQQGYRVLGPLLAASDVDDASNMTRQEYEQFLKLWRDVKKFRTAVQTNIHELRDADLDDTELQLKLAESTPIIQSWERVLSKD